MQRSPTLEHQFQEKGGSKTLIGFKERKEGKKLQTVSWDDSFKEF